VERKQLVQHGTGNRQQATGNNSQPRLTAPVVSDAPTACSAPVSIQILF